MRVICIRDITLSWQSGLREAGITFPVKGVVYTVRDFVSWTHPETKELQLGYRLHEIINPVRDYIGGKQEGFFLRRNFRPLIEKKTDISELEKLLKLHELETA